MNLLLQSLKTSFLLLWKGEKIWTLVSLLSLPAVFLLLSFAGKTFFSFVFSFLTLLFLIDYVFIVTTQALDVAEILVFPQSVKQKYNFLLAQSALGIKLLIAVVFLTYIFIVYPAHTDVFLLLQLSVLYFLYCMFFTNYMLLAKRRKAYSFLMKHVFIIFIYFPLLFFSMEGMHENILPLQVFYKTHNWLIIFVLLAALPLFYLLNLAWFKNILHKKPFYDLEVVLKHNRKKFGF